MHQNHPSHRNLYPAFVVPSGISVVALVLSLTLGGCANFPFGKPAENIRGGYAQGDQVTMLLPTSGPYASVADAVRDGVRAAHVADDTGAVPELGTADSSNPRQVPKTLTGLAEEGTTQVIGPLQKASVDALAKGGALPIPTLALNEGTFAGKPPANLYQFSLSPETGAAAVADIAKAQGLSRALMLYPSDKAGERRADAFRSQWKQLGGTLVGETAFRAGQADDAKVVAGLLAKGEADFIFLAASVDQARAIYPRIRGDAAAMPVIATSDVYPGDSDQARDKVLAGLYFVDMPWMLGVAPEGEPLTRDPLKTSPSYLATPLGRRLYAMGIDAYRLAPRVAALAADPAATFPGQTGTLSIDAAGRVRRTLILGRYTESGPVAVDVIKTDALTSAGRVLKPERASS